MINITVLGATGSIGVSTLDVVNRHQDRYQVFALTANSRVDELYRQCLQFKPKYAVMVDEQSAGQLREKLSQSFSSTEVLSGVEGLNEVASHPDVDYVMAAIVGAAGLSPSLAAAKAGKRVLLANKEALVMSGRIFMDEVQKSGAELLPIDSEHNAIFQCMPADMASGSLQQNGITRILLTASGGPFRTMERSALQNVTPEQACAHPNWSMGAKISVDSASMMNKGLEVIEACWLFACQPKQVEVVVHPQSVIHSMVEYVDGSVLAQLGNPDMRTPIAHAMAWPERMESGVGGLNMFDVAHLDFEKPDMERFPCLRLAYEAIEAGGTAPALLNAANEVAVDAFLKRKVAFVAIPEIIESTLNKLTNLPADELEVILEQDAKARVFASDYIAERA